MIKIKLQSFMNYVIYNNQKMLGKCICLVKLILQIQHKRDVRGETVPWESYGV